MNGDQYRAAELLERGIYVLVWHPGRIKERLWQATIHGFGTIGVEHLPPETQEEFEGVMHELRKAEPQGNEGAFAASVEALTEDQAMALAQKLFSAYQTVARSKWGE